MLSIDPARLIAAAGLFFLYAILCAWAWRRARAARRAGASLDGAAWTVVYASQTGAAESLARQAAAALAQTGEVACLPLDRLDAERLQGGGRFLFIVSTHGQGEAPDNGRYFARQVLGRAIDLSQLEFGLLALGDSHYPDFCAFGRRLADWLMQQGARAGFAPIEVDRLDAQALTNWRRHLVELLGAEEIEFDDACAFLPWRLVHRRHLNPGSQGGEVHELRFSPVGHQADWQSGDLALLRHPSGDEVAREYSIASLPGEGGLSLLVRRSVREDGSVGVVSGWLTGDLPLGGEVSLAIRPHRAFRLEDNLARPAIFIGNGVGLAGLRGHLAARIAHGNGDNWLLFGERNAANDYHWRDELLRWQALGQIRHLDAVFSRDGEAVRYVQEKLAAESARLRVWLERGAAIYVCGSRQGMGEGVEAVLRDILGENALAELALSGAYRRDVF